MAQHIRALTSLRGIAALLVVIHHCFSYLLPEVGLTVSSYSQFFSNGYLWVDFFFILSGFIMTHVYANQFSSGVNSYTYRAFLFSRFARIYPLHLFMLLLFIGVELTKSSSFTGEYSLTGLLTNISLLQALDLSSPPLFGRMTYWNQPAWSISADWIAYLILPFLLVFFLKVKKLAAILVYSSALLGLLILMKLTYGHLDFLGLLSLARCTLEAILGITIYQLYQSNYSNYFKSSLVFLISLVWLGIVMHYNLNDILSLPAFCLLIVSASLNRSKSSVSSIINSRLIIYLGTISYSIYMVHWFMQELIKLFWLKTFNSEFGSNFNTGNSLIFLMLFMFLVVMVASLTYKFIELPMRNRLKSTAFYQKYIYYNSNSIK